MPCNRHQANPLNESMGIPSGLLKTAALRELLHFLLGLKAATAPGHRKATSFGSFNTLPSSDMHFSLEKLEVVPFIAKT